MDRRSTKRMRLDKRLIGRAGWIAREELAREIDALPDVAGKIAPPEPGGEGGPGRASAPPQEREPR